MKIDSIRNLSERFGRRWSTLARTRLFINRAIPNANDTCNYYVNHALVTKRLFSRCNLNSLSGSPDAANDMALPRRSLFFHGLLAGSQGYIHQTPSAPIVSLHLRSSNDLQDPFRLFMHTFKYRQSRKFPAHSWRADFLPSARDKPACGNIRWRIRGSSFTKHGCLILFV